MPPLSEPGTIAMLMGSAISGLPNLSAACTVTGLMVTPAVVLLGWLRYVRAAEERSGVITNALEATPPSVAMDASSV